MTRYIYHVLDWQDRVRYVGCSANPKARLLAHRSTARSEGKGSRTGRFWRWLWREMKAGRDVRVETIGQAGENWKADERAEILRIDSMGEPILNTIGLKIKCSLPKGSYKSRGELKRLKRAALTYEMARAY